MTVHPSAYPLQFLGLSVQSHENASQDDREAIWDALQLCCVRHNAYLGGTSDQALVLFNRDTPRVRSALTRWLDRQQAIASFDLALPTGAPELSTNQVAVRQANMASIPSGLMSAALEALANYQQHLLEALQHTVDLMPGLANTFHTGSQSKRHIRA